MNPIRHRAGLGRRAVTQSARAVVRLPAVLAAVVSLMVGGACGDTIHQGNQITEVVPGGPVAVDPGLVVVAEDTSATVTLAGFSEAADDALTVAVVGLPAHGSLDSTGGAAPLAVTFTPVANYNGYDQLAFQVADADGHSSPPVVVAFAVEPVNDPPVATDDVGLSTDSVTPLVVDVLANDSDVDGDPLRVVHVGEPTDGRVTINPDDTLTYLPNPAFTGAVQFDYTVRDPAGATDSAHVSVEVLAGTAVTITRFTCAPDVVREGESTTLSWEAAAASSCHINHGVDTGGATSGSVEVSPVTATVYELTCDGPGGPASAEAAVEVLPADYQGKRPVPVSPALVALAEDGTVALLLTGAEDGDSESSLEVDVNVPPAHGTLDATSGPAPLHVTYAPDANYNGYDALTFRVFDASGVGSEPQSVILAVTAVNDPPVAVDDEAATDSVTPLTLDVLANDGDPDGEPLRVIGVTPPTAGSAAVNLDDTITYLPDPSASGTVTFDYTVRDAAGATASATVTVSVTPGTAVAITQFEAHPTVMRAGESVTLSWSTTHATACAIDHGVDVASATSGDIQVSPVIGTIYRLACDGPGGPVVAETPVAVLPSDYVGDRPLPVAPGLASLDEDSALDIPLTGTQEGTAESSLSVEVTIPPAHGALDATAGDAPLTVRYTPDANFNGFDAFTFRVLDPAGLSSTPQAVLLMVAPVNDPPVAVDDTDLATTSVAPLTIDVLANDSDVDGDRLQVVAVGPPTSGSVAINLDDTLTFVPDPASAGTVTFDYTVRDPSGASDTATVSVDVTAGVAVAIDAFTAAPEVIRDGEVATLSWSATAATSCSIDHGAASGGPGVGSVEVSPPIGTIYTLTCQGPGGPATAEAALAVLPADWVGNRPLPVAPALVSLDEDSAAAVVLTGTQEGTAESDLTVEVTATPAHGQLDTAAGSAPLTVTYTPDGDYNGYDAMAFRVVDPSGLASQTLSITLVVAPVNDPPYALDDSASTDTVTPVTIDVLANDGDPDGDRLEVVSVSPPTAGSVSVNRDDTLTYTPAHPAAGTITFDYVVRDAGSATATATVSVDVTLGTPVSVTRFTASPDLILAGESTTLAWSASQATACSIDHGVDTGGSVAGAVQVSPLVPMIYRLSCSGPGGPAYAEVAVRVDADSDGDGLADVFEAAFGLNPLDPDTDHDGLWDGVEDANHNGVVDGNETDPRDADCDDDHWLDGEEDANHNGVVDPGETDPRNPDSDGDGFCDGPRTDNDGDGIDPVNPCVGQEVVFVDAGATGADDGTRWSDAVTRVEDATAYITAQIWVAEGTYTPASANAGVLTMVPDVDVYGGFIGSERHLDERPDPLRMSTLSGDFNGDDVPGDLVTNRSDNSVHVVVAAAGARLDGFTISGGLAAPPNDAQGAGLLVNGADGLVVANVRITGNRADNGGGIACATADVTLDQLVVDGNQAPSNGGGMLSGTGCSFALSNSVFRDNHADGRGGAIENAGTPSTFTDVTFLQNSCGFRGGALLNEAGSDPTLTRVVFRGNNAPSNIGGGIYNWGASPVLVDVLFDGNHAGTGGAMGSYLSTYVMVDSLLVGNTAVGGGGLDHVSSSPILTNVTIRDSYATTTGGAMDNNIGSSPTLTNVTLVDNTAGWSIGIGGVGGIKNWDLASAPVLTNVILWGSAPAGTDLVGGSPVATYTASEQVIAGEGNVTLTADPLVEAASGPLFLDQSSPCVDAGLDAAADDPLTGYEALGLPHWSALTTDILLTLDADGPGANDVDMGRHYNPDDVFIDSLVATATDLSWTTHAATACQVANSADSTVHTLAPDELDAGSWAHGHASGTVLTLTCQGTPLGATATAVVP